MPPAYESLCLATGILLGMLYYRQTGWACGGIITPGVVAMYIHEPARLGVSLAAGLLAALLLEGLVRLSGIFGRQRLAAALLIALALRYPVAGLYGEASLWLGWVVPGLIAARLRPWLEAWLAGPERRLLDVEARIFADAVGDPLAAGFFCGSFEGTDLGRFLYVVDPMAHEQVTLGQFVRADLSKRDERRARRTIEKAQREGKLIGLEVADLGTSSLIETGYSARYCSRGRRPISANLRI